MKSNLNKTHISAESAFDKVIFAKISDEPIKIDFHISKSKNIFEHFLDLPDVK